MFSNLLLLNNILSSTYSAPSLESPLIVTNFGNIDNKNCPTILLWPRPIPLISAVALKVIADAFEDGDEMVNCSQTCRIYMDKKLDTMIWSNFLLS